MRTVRPPGSLGQDIFLELARDVILGRGDDDDFVRRQSKHPVAIRGCADQFAVENTIRRAHKRAIALNGRTH